MKTTVILTLAAALTCLCGCSKDDNSNRPPKEPYTEETGPYDGYFWDADNIKVPLEFVFDKHFLIFKEADSQRILSELKEKGLTVVDTTYRQLNSATLYPYYPPEMKNCVHVVVNGEADPSDIEGMVYSTHLYHLLDYPNMDIGWTNYLTVGIESEADLELVEEYAKKLGAYMIRESFTYKWVTLLCTNKSSGNQVEVANMLHESGKFLYAEPALMTFIWW